MKLFKTILLSTAFTSTLLAGDALDGLLEKMSGTDYTDRQEARLELYSMAADVTSRTADPSDQEEFAFAVFEALQDADLDTQGRVFLTRILTRIGTEDSVPGLLAIAGNSGENAIVRAHALMAVSVVPGKTVSKQLIAGLKAANANDKLMWWQAVARQLDSDMVKSLIDSLNKSKLSDDPDAWISLGKIGGADAASLLAGLLEKVEPADRPALEKAILESRAANLNVLKKLLKGSSDAGVKTGAFKQMLETNPSASVDVAKDILANDDSKIRQRVVRLSLESGNQELWDLIEANLGNLSPAELETFIVTVGEQERKEYEQKVKEHIGSDSFEIQVAALTTLARIGTSGSTQAILAAMDDDDETIQELAIYALAQVNDPKLDDTIVTQVKNVNSSNREQMIRLIGIRNSDGAVDILNNILTKGSADPDLAEILKSVEAIGDVDSCRLILSKILENPKSSELRRYQLTLKRLALRLAITDYLWENAFLPAIRLAPTDVSRCNVIEILDCISNEDVLDYCIECLGKEQPEEIQQVALATLKRWTDMNIGEHWLDVVKSRKSSESEIRDAKAGIIRVIDSKSVSGKGWEKAEFALQVVLEVEDDDFRQQILETVHSNGGLKDSFEDSTEKYRFLIEAWDELD